MAHGVYVSVYVCMYLCMCVYVVRSRMRTQSHQNRRILLLIILCVQTTVTSSADRHTQGTAVFFGKDFLRLTL